MITADMINIPFREVYEKLCPSQAQSDKKTIMERCVSGLMPTVCAGCADEFHCEWFCGGKCYTATEREVD